ncbi:MAG: PD40 domain-containing protein [Acidobacteria bacterium]|nr:PD40 domain-containing protein [Acidobacteriota bacterium]
MTLITLPLDGGPPIKSQFDLNSSKRLFQVMGGRMTINDFWWAKSGRFLYSEVETRGVRNLWRIKVEPETLEFVGEPQRLTTGAGQDGSIAISSDGKKLAFVTRRESTRVWSFPLDAVKGQIKGEGQPLTASGIETGMPDLSRDGKKLVYVKSIGGKEEFWEKSLEDGQEKLLAADDFLRATPRWSWDGKWLAYRRCGFNLTAFTIGCNLVVRPAGGGAEQILTSTSRGGNTFDWSSDGSRVLVTSFPGSSKKAGLALIPISAAPQAETKAQIVAADPEMNLWQGRFSPDGKWVTLNGIKEGGQSTIYVVSSAGGELVRITEGKYWDDKPRWSPDGKMIYFISIRTGFLNVWAIRFDPVIRTRGQRHPPCITYPRSFWKYLGARECGSITSRQTYEASFPLWKAANADLAGREAGIRQVAIRFRGQHSFHKRPKPLPQSPPRFLRRM